MSVNGVTGIGTAGAYDSTYKTTAKAAETAAQEGTTAKDSDGVVYEPSEAAKKTYKPDTALIAKLKADADARTANLRSIVEQMMTKQGTAYNNANDIWSFLSGGNFTVDPATKAQGISGRYRRRRLLGRKTDILTYPRFCKSTDRR